MNNSPITCARCNAPLLLQDSEFCWYCIDNLCYKCWEEYGHCGHPEADESNRLAAEGKRSNRPIPHGAMLR